MIVLKSSKAFDFNKGLKVEKICQIIVLKSSKGFNSELEKIETHLSTTPLEKIYCKNS